MAMWESIVTRPNSRRRTAGNVADQDLRGAGNLADGETTVAYNTQPTRGRPSRQVERNNREPIPGEFPAIAICST
jgi:hypothetical protein